MNDLRTVLLVFTIGIVAAVGLAVLTGFIMLVVIPKITAWLDRPCIRIRPPHKQVSA